MSRLTQIALRAFRTLVSASVLVLATGTLVQAQARKISLHRLTGVERQTLVDAALAAQTLCYREIYRDTFGYGQCLRNLMEAEKASPFKSLGIAYFGFSGALSYMRVSQLGADQMAVEFLGRYRSLQKKLAISDEALCAIVPGNCTTRIAQALQMEQKPPALISMQVRCIANVCSISPINQAEAISNTAKSIANH